VRVGFIRLDVLTNKYRFESEIPPVTPLRLKIEVNTREHFAVLGMVRKRVRSNLGRACHNEATLR
jgi:hypothetical protein